MEPISRRSHPMPPTDPAPARGDRLRRQGWAWYLVPAFLVVAAGAGLPRDGAWVATYLAGHALAIAAVLAAMLIHRPVPERPWRLLGPSPPVPFPGGGLRLPAPRRPDPAPALPVARRSPLPRRIRAHRRGHGGRSRGPRSVAAAWRPARRRGPHARAGHRLVRRDHRPPRRRRPGPHPGRSDRLDRASAHRSRPRVGRRDPPDGRPPTVAGGGPVRGLHRGAPPPGHNLQSR